MNVRTLANHVVTAAAILAAAGVVANAQPITSSHRNLTVQTGPVFPPFPPTVAKQTGPVFPPFPPTVAKQTGPVFPPFPPSLS